MSSLIHKQQLFTQVYILGHPVHEDVVHVHLNEIQIYLSLDGSLTLRIPLELMTNNIRVVAQSW